MKYHWQQHLVEHRSKDGRQVRRFDALEWLALAVNLKMLGKILAFSIESPRYAGGLNYV